MKIHSVEEDVYILAIESSCDETAASVVKNGREVLSNVISSQIALHTLYGGVVPEIASRKHIEKVNPVSYTHSRRLFGRIIIMIRWRTRSSCGDGRFHRFPLKIMIFSAIL